MGRLGWVRFNAWIWLFSSTDSTTESSGGFMYNSTTSRSFSSKRLSLDSLKVSTRCGRIPRALHTFWIVDFDNPERFAIDRTDQCVEPSSGLECNVSWTMASIRSWEIVG